MQGDSARKPEAEIGLIGTHFVPLGKMSTFSRKKANTWV
jgi:hypothetical protein